MTQGILLVGGLGTRLMPLTRSVPKPMLPVAGLPVTEHQLMAAKDAGITSIVLAASYLSTVFIPYFGDGSQWGIQLQYAVESEPLGTGGAIRNAAKLLNDTESIAIFNGDVLSAHDLKEQIRKHESWDADVTLHLTRVADARAYGCVPTTDNGRVTAFLEKMEVPVADTINAGCYIFNPRVIDNIPDNSVVSIERDTFPQLIAQGRKVHGFIDQSYWIDIGTPQTLLQGSSDLVAGRSRAPALERLGIDRHDGDYIAMDGATIAANASLTGGSSVGRGADIAAGAVITACIIGEDSIVGKDAWLDHCFVAAGANVAPGARYENQFIGSDGELALIAGK